MDLFEGGVEPVVGQDLVEERDQAVSDEDVGPDQPEDFAHCEAEDHEEGEDQVVVPLGDAGGGRGRRRMGFG